METRCRKWTQVIRQDAAGSTHRKEAGERGKRPCVQGGSLGHGVHVWNLRFFIAPWLARGILPTPALPIGSSVLGFRSPTTLWSGLHNRARCPSNRPRGGTRHTRRHPLCCWRWFTWTDRLARPAQACVTTTSPVHHRVPTHGGFARTVNASHPTDVGCAKRRTCWNSDSTGPAAWIIRCHQLRGNRRMDGWNLALSFTFATYISPRKGTTNVVGAYSWRTT